MPSALYVTSWPLGGPAQVNIDIELALVSLVVAWLRVGRRSCLPDLGLAEPLCRCQWISYGPAGSKPLR